VELCAKPVNGGEAVMKESVMKERMMRDERLPAARWRLAVDTSREAPRDRLLRVTRCSWGIFQLTP
jgi:hypothetical protein